MSDAKPRRVLASAVVRQLLREELHAQSLALTQWIIEQLASDPRLAPALDRVLGADTATSDLAADSARDSPATPDLANDSPLAVTSDRSGRDSPRDAQPRTRGHSTSDSRLA